MISGSPDLLDFISILFMNLPEPYLAVVFIEGEGYSLPPLVAASLRGCIFSSVANPTI